MNLIEYELENEILLMELNDEHKKEYKNMDKIIKFEDSVNIRKIITKNTLLKELLEYQKENKLFHAKDNKDHLFKVYESTPRIDSKYRKISKIMNIFSFSAGFFILSLIWNIIDGYKFETETIEIPSIFIYATIILIIIDLIFNVILEYTKERYINNLFLSTTAFVIIFILKELFPLNIKINIYHIFIIIVISIIGALIVNIFRTRELEKLQKMEIES